MFVALEDVNVFATKEMVGVAGSAFTIIVSELDVAVFPLTQVAFEVISHVTILPIVKLELLNEFSVPTFPPFTFH